MENKKMSDAMPKIYLVIPCYNEEEVLPLTAKELLKKINKLIAEKIISEQSKIMFVDDGSKDETWKIIEALHNKNSVFEGLKLSRNKGHQNAVLAGLMTAKEYCDAAISLDADLQDDINAVDAMIYEFSQGKDIVYGVRSSREKDNSFKRNTALLFYKLMQKMGVEIIYNHADYRLISRRALEALEDFKEVNLFLRGIVPLIGYSSTTVEYERGIRAAGESKYPLKKMIAFAIEGVTSMSVKPIRLITSMGFLIFLFSLLFLLYSLIMHFIGKTVAGWSSLFVSIWALGGLQLFSIGVIGEYIGKIYMETKQRPRFIIDKYLKRNCEEKD